MRRGPFSGWPRAGCDLIGVELDPTTAAIAQALYPHADIRAESFTDTRLPPGSADLVIGNVPFVQTIPYDSVHNPGRHSLHNYAIVKSLAATRPGGLVAVLTSRWTLDARDQRARVAIHRPRGPSPRPRRSPPH